MIIVQPWHLVLALVAFAAVVAAAMVMYQIWDEMR